MSARDYICDQGERVTKVSATVEQLFAPAIIKFCLALGSREFRLDTARLGLLGQSVTA